MYFVHIWPDIAHFFALLLHILKIPTNQSIPAQFYMKRKCVLICKKAQALCKFLFFMLNLAFINRNIDSTHGVIFELKFLKATHDVMC